MSGPTPPPPPAPPPPPRPVWTWIGTVAGLFLGGVLLVATWGKVIDPAAFVELLEVEGLTGWLPAWVVASIGLVVETGLGFALLLGIRRVWVLLPTAGLCLFFLWLTGRAYIAYLGGDRDPASACGCFGNLVERTPPEAFWGDLLLLVPPLCLAFLGRPRSVRLPRVRLELIGAAVLMVLAFAWKAQDLPLDDLATRMRPGATAGGLCVGQGEARVCLEDLAPELASGRHIVIIAELGLREFRYAVPRLNALASSDAAIGLFVFTSAEPEEVKTFQWELGPTFEIRTAPARLLRPLYRRTPRAAFLEDGRVMRTYDGLPPADEFTGSPRPKED